MAMMMQSSDWGHGGMQRQQYPAQPHRSYSGTQGHSDEDNPFGALSYEESHRLASAFEESRDKRGYVNRDSAWQQLENRTGLPRETLNDIWYKSDLDRDGRLSLREFVCVMHLAERARYGKRVPLEVRPENQAALVTSVERLVNQHGHHSPHGGGGITSPTHSVGGADHHPHGHHKHHEHGRHAHHGHHEMGQLARIFQEAAERDPDELRRISHEVLQERRELQGELSRQRDVKEQLQDVRKLSCDLHDDHWRAEVEITAAKRRILHLQEEHEFLQNEFRLAEGDLDVLRDSGKRHGVPRRDPRDPNVVSEEEMLRREKAVVEQKLREIEAIAEEKTAARATQQTLLEQQRLIEHDRNLILTAIEGDYAKLHTMRTERLKMWEERNELENEKMKLSLQSASPLPDEGWSVNEAEPRFDSYKHQHVRVATEWDEPNKAVDKMVPMVAAAAATVAPPILVQDLENVVRAAMGDPSDRRIEICRYDANSRTFLYYTLAKSGDHYSGLHGVAKAKYEINGDILTMRAKNKKAADHFQEVADRRALDKAKQVFKNFFRTPEDGV